MTQKTEEMELAFLFVHRFQTGRAEIQTVHVIQGADLAPCILVTFSRIYASGLSFRVTSDHVSRSTTTFAWPSFTNTTAGFGMRL